MATATLNPTHDTSIRGDGPTVNNDTNSALYCGESNAAAGRNWRCLLRFDLSEIPASAQVSVAKFRLWQTNDYSDNARTKRVYRVKRNWVSAETTWKEYSSGHNWQTAGCGGANDRDATAIGSLSLAANESNGEYKEWNLAASAVQEWISGDFPNNGIIVITDTETNDMYAYESIDHAGGHKPQLYIEYTAGPPKVKTWNGVAIASVKTINGIAIANVKSIQGLT